MSVSASMVKELRERTGAGMMDCKKALVQSNGDAELAAENLRKSGIAKADKKSGRVAAEGRVVIATEGNRAVIVDINSETDFAAKDENFMAFVESVAAAALQSNAVDAGTLADAVLADGRSVEAARTELVAKIGENVTVRRHASLTSDGPIGAYAHGGKIGAVAALDGGDATLARDIAMHVAASNPSCIDESGVPADVLAREHRILTEQAQDSGKPADIIEKMVAGRVAKFLKEITLLGQPYVKDPDISVGKLVKDANASIKSFTRFEVGEGVEKKQENFAEEVMKQIEDAKTATTTD